MLDVGAGGASGPFGTHRERIVMALECIHFLGHDIGVLADLADEQLGVLDQRCAHFAKAVAFDNRTKMLLEPLPAHGLLWQDVFHPANGSKIHGPAAYARSRAGGQAPAQPHNKMSKPGDPQHDENAQPTPPRVAAIDLGKVRVGLAISDELGMLAHPRPPLDGRNHKLLLGRLAALARDEGIDRFLVGFPLAMSGEQGIAAKRAIRFCQRLADATKVEVELLDERLTTVEAERLLRAGGARPEQIGARVDGAAAAILLQQWLDKHAPSRNQ